MLPKILKKFVFQIPSVCSFFHQIFMGKNKNNNSFRIIFPQNFNSLPNMTPWYYLKIFRMLLGLSRR
eukprot:TRINITY_DN325_c0_g1_i3.p1 TRINITY_DN325_c0_g1~~TRINITY_DN325_c0_g1_i3.p1  ORF type:complete len:67 (+),score=2.97 TRINITY_DN325_c0_g1_i3:45-245(+)